MSTPLVRTYMNQLDRLRTTAATTAGARWRRLEDYDTEAPYVRSMSAAVEGMQRVAAATTASYIATYARQRPAARVLDARSYTTSAIRGVDAHEVWRRPFKTMRTALANGHDWPTALAQGEARARQLASTDVQLAATHAAADMVASTRGIVGFRRVLRGTCAQCAADVSHVYRPGEVMALHPGCKCGSRPVMGDEDVGGDVSGEPGQPADITRDERDAVTAYTSQDGLALNRRLRRGRSLAGDHAAQVERMDALFDRTPPLRTDTTMYRGVRLDEVFEDQGIDDLTGVVFRDNGFVSTSADRASAAKFPGNLLEIRAPRGTKALDVGSMGSSSQAWEREWLLPRGTTLRIIEVRDDGSAVAEVVLDA